MLPASLLDQNFHRFVNLMSIRAKTIPFSPNDHTNLSGGRRGFVRSLAMRPIA
jgi:hypothetical protein